MKQTPIPRARHPRRTRRWTDASDEDEHAEPPAAGDEQAPARLADGRRCEGADESACAERGRQQAEPLGTDVQRVGGEERDEDVEVEADGADDRDDDQDDPQPAIATQKRENASRSPLTSLAVESRATRWSSSVRIRAIAASTARKLTALSAKQTPVPTRRDQKPGDRGTDDPGPLKSPELRATAFGSSRGPTISKRQRLARGRVEREGDSAERVASRRRAARSRFR